MFALMGDSPHKFVMKGDYRKFADRPQVQQTGAQRPGGNGLRGFCIHRTFFENDFIYFCRGFRACYTQYGSLEALFASASGIWEGISLFRETMAAGNRGRGPARTKPATQADYSKHISNPEAGSACKRLNLALRWLVRREGPVDLGLWKSISPSSLFIPLDLHVGRAARELGFLDSSRKGNDKKAVISITEKLRELCPEDPIKYDLALFGYSLGNA